jgi:hypothetical protein
MESFMFPLCAGHRTRFRKAHYKHFHGVSHLAEEARYATWVATWAQQMDAELESDVRLPPEPPKSSYAEYASKLANLPEHATQAGQAAIAKRNKEQAALEKQLAADAAEYARGRRMELELELKTKREAEKRKAVPK